MRTGRYLAAGLAVVGLALAGCGGNTTTGTSPGTTTSRPSASANSPSVTPGATATPSGAGAQSPGRGQPPVTVTVSVWFLDANHARTGQEPIFRPVSRQVSPPALAGGALDALFAGPTAAERATGLTFLASGATGYSRLHISGGIAYVTLTGECSSGGSTMTIAGEIMPTLKQFSSVMYVKIFAPDGSTERPTGATDSIPTCLEP